MKHIHLILFLLASLSHKLSMTYDVVIESMLPDSRTDPERVDFGTLRITRVGRNNFTISGTLSIRKSMGNEARILMEVSKKNAAGIGYNQYIARNEQPLCHFFDSEDSFIPLLRNVSNFPEKGTCPFPRDDITINNFKFDEKMLPLVVPKGSYVLNTQLLEENRIFGGISVTLVVN